MRERRELVKIEVDNNGQQVVSARELHEFLEVITPFRKWIERMLEYGFEENKDFVRVDKNVRGSKTKDYALNLDTAKEISMLQRTNKGKQARKYFIRKEKEAKELVQQQQPAIPQTYSEALRLAAEQAEKIEELEPKGDVYDQVSNADNSLELNDAAKSIGIGRNKMMKRMRSMNILMSNNIPFQNYIDQGYFIVKITPITEGKIVKNYPQTFVTGKGLTWLTKVMIF